MCTTMCNRLTFYRLPFISSEFGVFMSKRAKIPLPSNLAPDVFKCYPFYIPYDQEYIGMFFGALQQLTVWSSYDIDGTLAGKTVADVWAGVMDDARNSSCLAPCPGAYAIKDVIYCPQEPSEFEVRQMSTGDLCDSNERVYFSKSNFNVGAGTARVGYSFFDFVTDDPCVITVYEVRGFMFGTIVTHTWTLQWRDEFGVDHEVDQDDTEFAWTTSFTAQKLCLSSNHDFMAVITINQPKIAL